MRTAGIEVSLFIAPDVKQVEAAAAIGSEFVELHTGAFAEAFEDPAARERELERLCNAAECAHQLGLRVNAGHGLNYENLPSMFQVPHLIELNIGHSIVSRSIFTGLDSAVRDMLNLMAAYGGKG